MGGVGSCICLLRPPPFPRLPRFSTKGPVRALTSFFFFPPTSLEMDRYIKYFPFIHSFIHLHHRQFSKYQKREKDPDNPHPSVFHILLSGNQSLGYCVAPSLTEL